MWPPRRLGHVGPRRPYSSPSPALRQPAGRVPRRRTGPGAIPGTGLCHSLGIAEFLPRADRLPATAAAPDLQADHRAAQRRLGADQVDVGSTSLESCLGSLPRLLSPREIDLLSPLRCVGQNPDPVVRDLDETTKDRQRLLLAAFDDAHLTKRQE